MGNCTCVIDKTSGESFNKRRRRRTTVFHDEDDDGEKLLLGETSSRMTSSSSSSSSVVRREIKIRMTKKELEDLMRNIHLKGLKAEEILSMLLSDGGDQIVDISNHHQPWKPALQSIPEIN